MATQATQATEPAWRSTLYGVIRRPGEPRLLVVPDSAPPAAEPGTGVHAPAGQPARRAGRWSLPSCTAERRVWFREAGYVGRLFREQHGLEVAVLRCLAQDDDEAHREQHALYALEIVDRVWSAPAGARWAGREDLARRWLAPPVRPALREALETWLAEVEGGPVPAQRNPWAQEGWYAQAVGWMRAQLAARGRPPTGPVEQVKSWSISSVLRVPTAAGGVYFKAVPPLFAAEPVVTHALAQRFPQHIPAVLAIDPARRWMILEDAGPPLRGRTDVALWERLLRTFAQIQQAYAGHPGQSGRDGQVAALLALGCADRRLDVLASQVDPLLDDAGPLDGVEPAPVERLRAQAPRLRAMCAELAAAGVPPALVHGDLHAGNVAATDGDPVFFDWTDACVAHPFLDYVTIVGDDPARLGGDLARAAGRLRDAYLQPWTAYAPAARLRPALELGTTLGALHQAVSYQMITRSVEPAARHEWSGAMRSWLRRVLRRLEA